MDGTVVWVNPTLCKNDAAIFRCTGCQNLIDRGRGHLGPLLLKLSASAGMQSDSKQFDRRTALRSFATAVGAGCCSHASAFTPEKYGTSPPKPQAKTQKAHARSDYALNMQQFGGSLSSKRPPDQIPLSGPVHYDILIIGSGYGASIMAARLAQSMRPDVRLAVLERGAEWRPGDFPNDIRGIMSEARLRPLGGDRRSIYNPIGLYDFLQTDELRVLASSGLGGGSLINANVALKPDRDVFQQDQWPIALRDRDVLDPYYDLAAWELNVQTETCDQSHKMRAQRLAAQRLQDFGCHFEAANLTITRQIGKGSLPILNRQEMIQRACVGCGDCMSGCNIGAKNTLAMNYLPIARRCGAQIYTQCEVRKIYRHDDHYRVEYLHHHCDDAGDLTSTRRCVSASVVILGAGSVGTTEILLRSQSEHLQFSPSLGCNWTANGDALGFVDNSNLCTRTGGVGADSSIPGPGPTVQCNITYPLRPNLYDRITIQDGATPSAYHSIVKFFFLDMKLESTMPLLGMGHDGQHGRVVLHQDGNANILWPGLLQSPYRKKIEKEFRIIAQAHGGKYRRLHPPRDRVITVHPLGGCAMSDNPLQGVIDHRGQVYDMSAKTDLSGENATIPGLFVCDGSTFPTALAANPFFTIAAMAERNARLLISDPLYANYFSPTS